MDFEPIWKTGKSWKFDSN